MPISIPKHNTHHHFMHIDSLFFMVLLIKNFLINVNSIFQPLRYSGKVPSFALFKHRGQVIFSSSFFDHPTESAGRLPHNAIPPLVGITWATTPLPR